MINATIYRGDLHLFVYELDVVQNATSRKFLFLLLVIE